MEKKVGSTGIYETTTSGGVFVGKLSAPTKIGLTDQTKVALLEYLTESDDFHKLVCDITGTERKQVKVSPELEKLKEVECSFVRDIVDKLKAERANGKLLAEDNNLCRRENDKLNEKYNKLCEEFIYAKSTKYNLIKEYDRLKEDYDRIAESNEHLNKCSKNQEKTITNQMEEVVKLREELALKSELILKDREKSEKMQCKLDEVVRQNLKLIEETERLKKCCQIQIDLAEEYDKRCQKLQTKLDKASKSYGELIKTISDRDIKSI